MGLTIVKYEDINRDVIELDRPLWLTAERDRVVEDGDPDAAFLLGPKGHRMLRSDAEGLGLLVEGTDVVVDPADAEEVEYYEDMTVDRLRDILTERGLPVSGNKPELIARLVENDEAEDGDGDDESGEDESTEDDKD